MKMRSSHWLLLSGLLLSAAAWAEEARAPAPAPMRDTAGDVVRPATDASAAAVAAPQDVVAPAANANETEPGKGGEPVVARREKPQQDPFLLLLLQILRTPK